MFETSNIKFSDNESIQKCDICAISKQTKSPFNHSSERRKKPLEIIHSDVCGPFNVPTIGGARYFVTFIDNYSRYCTVYLMKNKSEVYAKLLHFKNMAENQLGEKN